MTITLSIIETFIRIKSILVKDYTALTMPENYCFVGALVASNNSIRVTLIFLRASKAIDISEVAKDIKESVFI